MTGTSLRVLAHEPACDGWPEIVRVQIGPLVVDLELRRSRGTGEPRLVLPAGVQAADADVARIVDQAIRRQLAELGGISCDQGESDDDDAQLGRRRLGGRK